MLLNSLAPVSFVSISLSLWPFCIPGLCVNHSKLILIPFPCVCSICVASSRVNIAIKLCWSHTFTNSYQNLLFSSILSVLAKGMVRGWSRLCLVMPNLGQEQWAENDAQKIPPGYEEKLLSCAVSGHWNRLSRAWILPHWRYSRPVPCAGDYPLCFSSWTKLILLLAPLPHSPAGVIHGVQRDTELE